MSEDGGETWIDASSGYTGAQVRAIAVSPDAPAQVFVAARSGFFGSHDGGSKWMGLNHRQAFGLEWNAVAIDPQNSQHILAANNWFGGIFESRDGGQAWEWTDIPKIEMQGWRVISFAPSDPRVVYAGSAAFFSAGGFDVNMPASGIYVSRNGGSLWEAANDALTQSTQITDLAIHPSDPQMVYATSPSSGLFRTGDGGANWVRLDSLPAQTRPRSIAVNPSQTGTLFVGMEFGGLYRSHDDGGTWESIAAGLPPEASIVSILFNPIDSNQMYFADHSSGVYRSSDGGQNWIAINTGLRTRAVNALAFTSDGLHLYAATEGEGVYRLDLDGQPPEGVAPPPPTSPSQEEPASPSEPDSPSAESPEQTTPSLPCIGGFAPILLVSLAWISRRRR